VVPEPRVKSPLIVRAASAVAEAVPDREKFPNILKAVPGIVLVPLPLRIRLS